MPAETQLGRMMSRPDPLLVWRWIAEDVPFGADFGVTPAYIESFELPFNNIKSEGVFFGGGYNYFPGFHDVSAFNVAFYGDSEGRTLKWLMHWKKQIKDFNTGIYKLPSDYKRAWTVSLLNPHGETVAQFTLTNCWPADTGQISLVYDDGSGRITFNQNFSLDNMEVV